MHDQPWNEAMGDFRADPSGWDHEPPNPLYYRPDFGDSATAYQVYESVSEGTPISPVFETEEAMLEWLIDDGSGLGIGGRKMSLTREQADSFVRSSYAPSMVYTERIGIVSGLELPSAGEVEGHRE
jgi:hypothetical protein